MPVKCRLNKNKGKKRLSRSEVEEMPAVTIS
jgi:hypothetical protein